LYIESLLPIGWRTFIRGKTNRPKVLLYFGLDCGMLEFFKYLYSRAVLQRTIVDFPAFLETGLAEKIAVCTHTTRLPKK
jgi:hypothetical protein